ncbi:MAG: hypothetical protein HKN62_10805 [Phycisphaerales bacterium]|nr:hypothetical protein [Phycisphaerales bacterium]
MLATTLVSCLVITQPASAPIDVDEARVAFVEAKRLSDADGGALWGHALYGPMLFVEPRTRFVVANERDGERVLRSAGGGLWSGTLPESIGVANTSVVWAGKRWSMVLWPLPEDPSWRGGLLMHESFHRLQPEIGLNVAMTENHHLDSAAGRRWMRMEWRALADALASPTPLESEALRDALVFRAYRQSLFKSARVEERALELFEGLAEYTGLRLSGLDAAAQWKRAIGGLHRYDRMPSFARSFAYGSGPPYGLLLDRARPGWREHVDGSSDLGRMLRAAVGWRLPPRAQLEAEAERRSEAYGGAEVAAEEIARDDARQARVAALRARFFDGPVLVVDLSGGTNYTFNPHDVHALDGLGTYYGTFRLAGPFGILEAPGGALMIETKRGRRRVTVPLPNDRDRDTPPVAGPGWTLELAPRATIGPGPREGDLIVKAD